MKNRLLQALFIFSILVSHGQNKSMSSPEDLRITVQFKEGFKKLNLPSIQLSYVANLIPI